MPYLNRQDQLDAQKRWRAAHPRTDADRLYNRKYQAEWRKANPEQAKITSARFYEKAKAENGERYRRMVIGSTEWRLAHPVEWLLRSAKSRAKKIGLEFSLNDGDIRIPKQCPVLDIPLIANGGKRSGNSPSLDRIDNSKGYVPGNVVVVSWRANRLKNNATFEELRKISLFYGRYWGKRDRKPVDPMSQLELSLENVGR